MKRRHNQSAVRTHAGRLRSPELPGCKVKIKKPEYDDLSFNASPTSSSATTPGGEDSNFAALFFEKIKIKLPSLEEKVYLSEEYLATLPNVTVWIEPPTEAATRLPGHPSSLRQSKLNPTHNLARDRRESSSSNSESSKEKGSDDEPFRTPYIDSRVKKSRQADADKVKSIPDRERAPKRKVSPTQPRDFQEPPLPQERENLTIRLSRNLIRDILHPHAESDPDPLTAWSDSGFTQLQFEPVMPSVVFTLHQTINSTTHHDIVHPSVVELPSHRPSTPGLPPASALDAMIDLDLLRDDNMAGLPPAVVYFAPHFLEAPPAENDEEEDEDPPPLPPPADSPVESPDAQLDIPL